MASPGVSFGLGFVGDWFGVFVVDVGVVGAVGVGVGVGCADAVGCFCGVVLVAVDEVVSIAVVVSGEGLDASVPTGG